VPVPDRVLLLIPHTLSRSNAVCYYSFRKFKNGEIADKITLTPNFEMIGHRVPELKQCIPQYAASYYLGYLRVKDAVSLEIHSQFVEVHKTLVTSWEQVWVME